MWSKLRHLLWPPKPQTDPAFLARMHEARSFGVSQRRASMEARRRIQQARRQRPGQGPVEDAIFPPWTREDRP